MNINCEHPVVILNPRLPELIQQYKCTVMDGYVHSYSEHELSCMLYDFPYNKFYPKKNNVGKDNVDNFVVMSETGEVFPMYYLVPCRKCVLCRKTRAMEWTNRALLETQCHKTLPFYLTLTYAPEHLPKGGSLCKEDIQLFWKRLRINLERNYGAKPRSLRYFMCGEYGSTYGRAHYHAIIWGLPYLTDKQAIKLFEDNWQKGFVYGHHISPIFRNRENKVVGMKAPISYVMKYMSKISKWISDHPEDNREKPFTLASRRGGIGSPYLPILMEYFSHDYKKLQLSFIDKFSGKEIKMHCPKFLLDKVFPTLSSLVPKHVRDTYKLFLDDLLHYQNYLYWHNEYSDKVPTLPFIVKILNKYRFLPYIESFFPNLESYDFGKSDEYQIARTDIYAEKIEQSYKLLKEYPIDTERIMFKLLNSEKFKNYLRKQSMINEKLTDEQLKYRCYISLKEEINFEKSCIF